MLNNSKSNLIHFYVNSHCSKIFNQERQTKMMKCPHWFHMHPTNHALPCMLSTWLTFNIDGILSRCDFEVRGGFIKWLLPMMEHWYLWHSRCWWGGGVIESDQRLLVPHFKIAVFYSIKQCLHDLCWCSRCFCGIGLCPILTGA